MEKILFAISEEQLKSLLVDYPNLGKNSHVGNIAVKVVELYFSSIDPAAQFTAGINGADLTISHQGKTEDFEIKGTADKDISWSKLKVSSQACHDALVNGMRIARVTNIGNTDMELFFMKHGEDFTLVAEPRWSLTKFKKTSSTIL